LQNLEGLKIYVAWIKNTVKGNIRSEFVSCLNTLENKEALPLLMELLKFSYERKVTVDVLDFDSFNSRVIGALIHLGVVSEENFICVKEALEKFVSQESELYENVKYLRHSIEEMEELFYLNNVPSYNADQARNIVESIQF
jgi:hypothetical protein